MARHILRHPQPRPSRRRLLALPFAAAAVLAAAPPALADTTVSIQDGPVAPGISGRHVLIEDRNTVFTDQPLDVRAERDGGRFAVTDTAGDIHAGFGCVKVGSRVECSASGVVALKYDGSKNNDFLTNATTTTAVMLGGRGNDRMFGGTARDRFDGQDGNDDAFGGPGPDIFVSEPGSDRLEGDDGTDTVDYSGANAPVAIRMDNLLADDGRGGEADRLVEVENAVGSAFNDVVLGANLVANSFDGRAGADIIRGLSGNDRIDGGAGADDISGGLGIDLVSYGGRPAAVSVSMDGVANDGAAEGDNVRPDVENVLGTRFNDRMTGPSTSVRNAFFGDAGNDVLTPGPGSDLVDGGSGDDRLFLRDGVKDTPIACGLGFDTVQIDRPLDETDAQGNFQLAGCEAATF